MWEIKAMEFVKFYEIVLYVCVNKVKRIWVIENIKEVVGNIYSSVVEYLPSICEALSSIPRTSGVGGKKEKEREGWGERDRE